jgi:hypothetical protein
LFSSPRGIEGWLSIIPGSPAMLKNLNHDPFGMSEARLTTVLFAVISALAPDWHLQPSLDLFVEF